MYPYLILDLILRSRPPSAVTLNKSLRRRMGPFKIQTARRDGSAAASSAAATARPQPVCETEKRNFNPLGSLERGVGCGARAARGGVALRRPAERRLICILRVSGHVEGY
ncbi:hypothetical protein EVAR_18738_1 [Eumeta japonica]|uniref:Uncharacterized protein n=1 Tax=Eumeta variegata TaxID=151549 RepID=A0A4C1UM86_EUMVA|nr:hypothetical protein EVAR_18738_1 [Eumeta japonica]